MRRATARCSSVHRTSCRYPASRAKRTHRSTKRVPTPRPRAAGWTSSRRSCALASSRRTQNTQATRCPPSSATQASSRAGRRVAAWSATMRATSASNEVSHPNSAAYISPCAITTQPRSPGRPRTRIATSAPHSPTLRSVPATAAGRTPTVQSITIRTCGCASSPCTTTVRGERRLRLERIAMISRRLSVLTSALLVTLAGALAAPTGPAPKPAEAATGRAAADPDTLLVRFRPGVAPRRAHTVLARDGATVLGPPSRTGYVALRAPGRAEALRRRLAADPTVATVEPNYRRRALAKPDDPRFKRQRRYLSLLRLPEAWDIGRGSPTIDIAVVDTGVDLDTPDLAGRIAPGYNAWTGGRTPPQDDNGHGTVVAGAAAATTDNHVGIAGAAWTARIIPVKALDASGWGDDVHVSAGTQWAVDHGAEIINLSLGDPSPSAALHAAVQYARSHGVLVVAAAGNSGVEAAYYPAAYPEVLAVGPRTSTGTWRTSRRGARGSTSRRRGGGSSRRRWTRTRRTRRRTTPGAAPRSPRRSRPASPRWSGPATRPGLRIRSSIGFGRRPRMPGRPDRTPSSAPEASTPPRRSAPRGRRHCPRTPSRPPSPGEGGRPGRELPAVVSAVVVSAGVAARRWRGAAARLRTTRAPPAGRRHPRHQRAARPRGHGHPRARGEQFEPAGRLQPGDRPRLTHPPQPPGQPDGQRDDDRQRADEHRQPQRQVVHGCLRRPPRRRERGGGVAGGSEGHGELVTRQRQGRGRLARPVEAVGEPSTRVLEPLPRHCQREDEAVHARRGPHPEPAPREHETVRGKLAGAGGGQIGVQPHRASPHAATDMPGLPSADRVT